MKKVIMAVAVFVAMSAVSVNATASVVPTSEIIYSVSPYYETASDAVSTLTVSGTTAKCKSKLIGHSNVTSIKVEQTLEKYSGWFWIWNSVDGANWTKTVNLNSISMSNTKSGLSSGTYRLKSVFTLTSSSGKTETITVYSDEKKVG